MSLKPGGIKDFHSRITRIDFLLILIFLFWSNSILLEYVRAVFIRLPILNNNNGHTAITVIFVIALVLALPQILKTLSAKALIFPFIIIIAYLFSYIAFPNNEMFLDQFAGQMILKMLPIFILGWFWDTDNTIDFLYSISLLTIFCALIYRLFIGEAMTNEQSMYQGNMVFAYDYLPHLCLTSFYAVKKTNILNIVLSVAGAMLLLTMGTRGAVACYLIFFLLMFIFIMKMSKKKLLILVLGGLLCVYILTGYRLFLIIELFEKLAAQFGLSVRIFEKLKDGVLFESQGRGIIQKSLVSALRGHALWGYGFFGDRVLTGTYAHNIILEFMIDFGMIPGTGLFLAFITSFIQKYRKSYGQNQKMFLLLLLVCSAGGLMFSGSYLTHQFFFLLLGICIKPNKYQEFSNR